MESGSIEKMYCESLDKFVGIRRISRAKIKNLLTDIEKLDGKRSYFDLVNAYCVVKYVSEINRLIQSNDVLSAISDMIREDLYELCIKVNPGLDIKKIRLSGDSQGEVILLGETNSEPESDIIQLEENLLHRIIGQQEAISVVSKNIRRSASGLRRDGRPIGSYIFVGQTGVGKTEMAKAIADCLNKSLLKIDCSEYSQSHEYAKLIGSPPGYLGHNEGGRLTEGIKSKPNSIVLFDEIEKAHTKVHNILLQIMDDGVLTDGKGASVNFRSSVIIMTSNIAVEGISQIEKAIGFGEKETLEHSVRQKETFKGLQKVFSPEFINRIDEIVLFKTLTDNDKRKIIENMMDELSDRAYKIGISLRYSRDVIDFILNKEDHKDFGARPIRRSIERNIEALLSDQILEKKIMSPDKCMVDVEASGIVIKKLS